MLRHADLMYTMYIEPVFVAQPLIFITHAVIPFRFVSCTTQDA